MDRLDGRDRTPVYFRFFREVCEMFAFLDDEAAGRVIHAACDYFCDGTEPDALNKGEQRLFDRLRRDIDKSFSDYEKKVEGGKKGAALRYGTDN